MAVIFLSYILLIYYLVQLSWLIKIEQLGGQQAQKELFRLGIEHEKIIVRHSVLSLRLLALPTGPN